MTSKQINELAEQWCKILPNESVTLERQRRILHRLKQGTLERQQTNFALFAIYVPAGPFRLAFVKMIKNDANMSETIR